MLRDGLDNMICNKVYVPSIRRGGLFPSTCSSFINNETARFLVAFLLVSLGFLLVSHNQGDPLPTSGYPRDLRMQAGEPPGCTKDQEEHVALVVC